MDAGLPGQSRQPLSPCLAGRPATGSTPSKAAFTAVPTEAKASGAERHQAWSRRIPVRALTSILCDHGWLIAIGFVR